MLVSCILDAVGSLSLACLCFPVCCIEIYYCLLPVSCVCCLSAVYADLCFAVSLQCILQLQCIIIEC